MLLNDTTHGSLPPHQKKAVLVPLAFPSNLLSVRQRDTSPDGTGQLRARSRCGAAGGPLGRAAAGAPRRRSRPDPGDPPRRRGGPAGGGDGPPAAARRGQAGGNGPRGLRRENGRAARDRRRSRVTAPSLPAGAASVPRERRGSGAARLLPGCREGSGASRRLRAAGTGGGSGPGAEQHGTAAPSPRRRAEGRPVPGSGSGPEAGGAAPGLTWPPRPSGVGARALPAAAPQGTPGGLRALRIKRLEWQGGGGEW